jgi:hypothetical protein
MKKFSNMTQMEKSQLLMNTARNEKPVYINFSATKMSNAVKPNTLVQFTDFMGRKYNVPVKNRPEMLRTMAFFAELKKESAAIKNVLSEYPVSYGQIPTKFHAEIRKQLKALKLSNQAIAIILA